MKNEQTNQPDNQSNNKNGQNPQQQPADKKQPGQQQRMESDLSAARPGSYGNQNQQSQGNQPAVTAQEKGNISVDNEGRIGKAHDKWPVDDQMGKKDIQQDEDDKRSKSDKTVTEPEIDAPVYEPEKVEKKIPQMGSNKNSQ